MTHGFRRPKNLRDELVRAKISTARKSLKPPGELNCDTRNKCKTKNCKYCAILDHSSRITSTYTGRSYITRKNVTCKSPNIIYCISCKTCEKQYVGQTKLRLMDRIQAHFNTIQSKDPKQQTDISHHLKQADHNGRDDVKVHILDFIYAFPDSNRAAVLRDVTEFRWMHRLRTQLPMGINTMDKPRIPAYCKKPKSVKKKTTAKK